MAFDGPSPFDGDPVYNYIDSISNQAPARVQAVLAAAFQEVIQGGAARQLPPELVSMLGLDPSLVPTAYCDVDEGVWAWACAEMLALALGTQPESTIPEPFYGAALSLPKPRKLVASALQALDVIGDTKRSELASLLVGSVAERSCRERLDRLRKDLERWQLRSV